MPKNSRRKKQTCQRAVRKRERYMHALRSQTAVAQDVRRKSATAADSSDPAAPAAKCTSTDLERVLPVQRMLESRGWVALPYSGQVFWTDAQGKFISLPDMWEFPAGFSGVELDDDDEELAPQKPTLSFADGILVETAGNWGGCEQHRCTKLDWPATPRGLAELPELLGKIEELSRPLDPGPYIECLADGPCAKLAEQRWGPRDPLDE